MNTAFNPLTLVPLKARKYVYPLLGLAALVYGVYQGANGDIAEALGALVLALGNGVAASNTPKDTLHDNAMRGSAP